MNRREHSDRLQRDQWQPGSRNLGVFAKYWQPGQVKTRLAKDLGDSTAAELYHQMLLTLLTRLEALESQITLYYSPPERESEFRRLPGKHDCAPQPTGGLSERSRHYFDQTLASYQKVIIIGSDIPHISLHQIETAFDLLDQVPMVIGPAEDGGYYLLGLTEAANFLFDDIQWSSSVVLEQTLERAREHQLNYCLLQPEFDLDDLHELTRFRDQFLDDPSSQLASLARVADRILTAGANQRRS